MPWKFVQIIALVLFLTNFLSESKLITKSSIPSDIVNVIVLFGDSACTSCVLRVITDASFEPSIDYVVTKIPRFDFEKFPTSKGILGVQMQSVGEVMAIGRTFQESIQKAIRGLEIGRDGFNEILDIKKTTNR